MLNKTLEPTILCVVDSAHGIYSGSVLAQMIKDNDHWSYSGDDDDLDILIAENFDRVDYLDIFVDVLDNTTVTMDNGEVWTLNQNEDIFAVSPNHIVEEEEWA